MHCSTPGGAIHISVCVKASSGVLQGSTGQLHWAILRVCSPRLCFVSSRCTESIILDKSGQDFSLLVRLSILVVWCCVLEIVRQVLPSRKLEPTDPCIYPHIHTSSLFASWWSLTIFFLPQFTVRNTFYIMTQHVQTLTHTPRSILKHQAAKNWLGSLPIFATAILFPILWAAVAHWRKNLNHLGKSQPNGFQTKNLQNNFPLIYSF